MAEKLSEFKKQWQAIGQATEIVVNSDNPSSEAIVNIVAKMLDNSPKSTCSSIVERAFSKYIKMIDDLDDAITSKITDEVELKDAVDRFAVMKLSQGSVTRSFDANIVDTDNAKKSTIVPIVKEMIESMDSKGKSVLMQEMYIVFDEHSRSQEKSNEIIMMLEKEIPELKSLTADQRSDPKIIKKMISSRFSVKLQPAANANRTLPSNKKQS